MMSRIIAIITIIDNISKIIKVVVIDKQVLIQESIAIIMRIGINHLVDSKMKEIKLLLSSIKNHSSNNNNSNNNNIINSLNNLRLPRKEETLSLLELTQEKKKKCALLGRQNSRKSMISALDSYMGM